MINQLEAKEEILVFRKQQKASSLLTKDFPTAENSNESCSLSSPLDSFMRLRGFTSKKAELRRRNDADVHNAIETQTRNGVKIPISMQELITNWHVRIYLSGMYEVFKKITFLCLFV